MSHQGVGGRDNGCSGWAAEERDNKYRAPAHSFDALLGNGSVAAWCYANVVEIAAPSRDNRNVLRARHHLDLCCTAWQ